MIIYYIHANNALRGGGCTKMKQMLKDKKGVFDQLSNFAIGLMGLALVLVAVFLLLSNLASNTQVSADGNASAAVTQSQTAAAQIPSWLSLIVLIGIIVLIIALVRGIRSK